MCRLGMFDNGPVLLDSSAKLYQVLTELAGDDALTWRGHLEVWGEQNPPGPAKWRLQLNDAKGNEPVKAMVGQYLVLTYGRLLVLDASEVQQ